MQAATWQQESPASTLLPQQAVSLCQQGAAWLVSAFHCAGGLKDEKPLQKRSEAKAPLNPFDPVTIRGWRAWEVELLMFPIQHEIQKGFLAGLKAQVRGGDPSDCYQGIC